MNKPYDDWTKEESEARIDTIIAEWRSYRSIGTVEEFTELMQAKKDGRLVALPCKIGDTVYFIDRFHNEVYKEAEIDGIGLHWTNRQDIGDYIPPSIIGKNVFLTCEEAVAALGESPSKEMEE